MEEEREERGGSGRQVPRRAGGRRGSGGWRGAVVAVLLVALAGLAGCEEEQGPLTQPQPVPADSPFRYPVGLWDVGAEGETVVMVHVTEAGAVDSVYVLEPSGEAAFDSAAVAGAYELAFTPGRRGERAMAMWARLPVRFSRSDSVSGGGP